MTLAGLADAVLADPTLAAGDGRRARRRACRALDLTGPAALRPFVVARAGPTPAAPCWRSPPTAREAEDLVDGARRPASTRHASAYYPSWETLPHERLSPRSDTVGRRLAVLRRLRHPGDRRDQRPAARSSSRRCARCCSRRSRGSATSSRSSSRPGDTAPLEDVVRRLADAAYSRVDLVEKRGEFAVRGGIVDVFPPTEEHPLRVEFWGDDVEEIRSLRGRRPAHPRAGRAALGAAVPRAAAHRRGARAGRRARPSSTRSCSS